MVARDASGEARGLVVLRIGWFQQPVAPLVDWLVPRNDPRVLSCLLAGAARIGLEAGVARLETWLPPACSEREHLHGLGFGEEETTFNLMLKVYDPILEIDWAGDHWFYTMGDADFY